MIADQKFRLIVVGSPVARLAQTPGARVAVGPETSNDDHALVVK